MEKVRRDPASLSQLVKDFDLEVVYKGLDYDTRMITIPDVNRPALQLVGFYDYFEPKTPADSGQGGVYIPEGHAPGAAE